MENVIKSFGCLNSEMLLGAITGLFTRHNTSVKFIQGIASFKEECFMVPILDFSAGGNYVFAIDGVVLWNSIFFYNAHLAGYLAFYIRISMGCFSKRWEFLENESVYTL